MKKKPLTVMMAWRGKAPLLPLETKFLGWPFALLRLSMAILLAFLFSECFSFTSSLGEQVIPKSSKPLTF